MSTSLPILNFWRGTHNFYEKAYDVAFGSSWGEGEAKLMVCQNGYNHPFNQVLILKSKRQLNNLKC